MQESLVESDEIVREIHKAFRGVILDGGISLDQTKIIDNYGRGCSDEEFAALPLKEIIDDWAGIAHDSLDEAECLAFLDDRGFLYYIPALMIRLLENYDSCSMMTIGTIGCLDSRSDYSRSRYSILTELQLETIARYLKALPSLVKLDDEDSAIIERSFQQYWIKFLR